MVVRGIILKTLFFIPLTIIPLTIFAEMRDFDGLQIRKSSEGNRTHPTGE
jgi:hypothetical protein